ncbi:hypothetical protein [Luteimonas sp. 100069]|uniref:hypothetical protein n=1 Tax=Luteimonas sp. 100069 TaxID=2006109 RepID=UPI000F511A23|nr:hypothetical protein [Luteimonas sp. 100069]
MLTLPSVYGRFATAIDKAVLVRPTGAGAVEVQKALAELVLLRLFFRLEAYLEDVTVRIACGTSYADGTPPSLLIASANRVVAISNLRRHGRAKSIELKWTIGGDIRNNVRHVIAPADPIYSTILAHEAELDRWRRVRNHIAHGNADTSKKFRPVVTHHYGAALPNITPGQLLLSRRFAPSLLDQAIIFARVFAKDLARI